MSEIAQWFNNKSIFITGATGYVGKCLVEKLLRDCPGIVTIYIIIRSKNGVSFEQRKTDFKNHLVFDALKCSNPKILDKLQIVEGDVCEPNLGMSMADRKLIADTVSVVFHSAADIRFDRTIIDAYNANVRGTEWLLDFGREFKNLLAFILVSTAYSQTIEIGKLEERHYETAIPLEMLRKFVENVDPDALDALTPKILGDHPNTYSFTKGMVEQLVYDYREKVSVAIARPPIIIGCWRQPQPGYTEGIHGINGWSLATGRGILRSMMCEEKNPCNVMPGDIVVNGIIISAYECGKRYENRISERNVINKDDNAIQLSEHCDEPLYFNITEENTISWKNYVDILAPHYDNCPFDLALWASGGSFKQNRCYNFISIMLFQILPAILIDVLLVLFRRQPFLIKVQRMICVGSQSLEYFMMNKFIFTSDKYKAAFNKLNDLDKEIFYGNAKMDINTYCGIAARGIKLYLAKESPANAPKARTLLRRLRALDFVVKSLLYYWVLNKVLSYFDVDIYQLLSMSQQYGQHYCQQYFKL